MLEIGILVFLVLAGGYWMTLWIMGRRDDVLHGQFVEAEGEDELAPVLAAPSPVPTRPKPVPAPKPVAAEPAPDNASLQSLLASIKQELNRATTLLYLLVAAYVLGLTRAWELLGAPRDRGLLTQMEGRLLTQLGLEGRRDARQRHHHAGEGEINALFGPLNPIKKEQGTIDVLTLHAGGPEAAQDFTKEHVGRNVLRGP